MNKWYGGKPAQDAVEMSNEDIREFNVWLYDNPEYQTLSWREQVAEFYAEKQRKAAA